MRRSGLTAALMLLITVPAAPAQSTPPSIAFRKGTEVFRRILYDRGFTPLNGFGDLAADPQHTILIVLGDADKVMEVPNGLKSYVARGGALFLATDRELSRPAEDAVSEMAGVRVSGESVICRDEKSCYKGLEFCPFLRPVPRANPDLFRNLAAENPSLSKAASNAPSFLELTSINSLPNLAWLPRNCFKERDANPLPTPPLFAVGGVYGQGRVLILADHSIFINEMMLPEDNGNVEFTYNCLQWLRGAAVEERSQVLFVEDGRINNRFEVPIKEMPDELAKLLIEQLSQHPAEAAKLALTLVAHYPKETAKLALDAADAADQTAQKIAPDAERSLEQFDKRDGFNKELLHMFADRQGLLRGLVVALSVLVVLYGCYKIGWKTRRRSDLEGPLLSAALYRLTPADTVVEQRRRDLIRGDNLWEPARELARQCLSSSGLPAAVVPPRLVIPGGWLRQWTTTARVRRLWRLAYGPPTRVSLDQWRRLLRDAQQVKTALTSGAVVPARLSPENRGEASKKA